MDEPKLVHMAQLLDRRRYVAVAVVGLALLAFVAWLSNSRSKLDPQAVTAKEATASKSIQKAKGKGAAGTVAVEAALVRSAKATTDIRAIGSLQSDESVQITSELRAASPRSRLTKVEASKKATS